MINADDANNWATITVNDKTVVNGTNKQAVDANEMGVGHYIYENNTATVWYVAPQYNSPYQSAVWLKGKQYPLQCNGFHPLATRAPAYGPPVVASAPSVSPPTYCTEVNGVAQCDYVSGNAPAPAPAVTTIVPAPTSSTIDKVPITFGKGGAYVAVSIGTMPATMLVDTGASGMTVSEALADWLVANGQATNGAIDHVTLAGGVQKDFRSVDIDSVTAGGHVVRNVHAGVVPDGADMLLGLGVLAQVSRKFAINVATSTLDFD